MSCGGLIIVKISIARFLSDSTTSGIRRIYTCHSIKYTCQLHAKFDLRPVSDSKMLLAPKFNKKSQLLLTTSRYVCAKRPTVSIRTKQSVVTILAKSKVLPCLLNGKSNTRVPKFVIARCQVAWNSIWNLLGPQPTTRTSWKLVGNPDCQPVAT